MHSASKRAFTLIELLVVIAIIAILAAVLFPVFAQAKSSAKAAASISNCKQTALAALIYSGDFDDLAMLSQSYSLTQDNPYSRDVAGNWITIWTGLIQPYMKSLDLTGDPAGPRWRIRTERNWPAIASQANMPGFGYNSNLFSPLPVDPYPPVAYKPISLTSVARPAESVFFTSSMVQYVDSNFGFYWALGTPIGWISWGNVDAPASGNPFTNWNGGGWGNNYNWTTLIETKPGDENGSRSGGVSMRVMRQGVFSFADGHTKRMSLNRAAVGTNWTPDIDNYSVSVIDEDRYLWDDK
jgi:prepilin-type N-terminal cleavage/methylation domain-containing protein